MQNYRILLALSAFNLVSALALHAAEEEALPRRAVLGLAMTPVPDQVATRLQLERDQGVVAMKPLAGFTADRAGVVEGDVLLTLNDQQVGLASVAAVVRQFHGGADLNIRLLRDGQPLELKTTFVEKPRDPGNENYQVIYSHVVSNGQRMRTIITLPRKSGKHPGFMFIQGFSPVSYDYTLEGAQGDVTTIDGPLLYEFANSGFVTLRIEKPGVGDSEGGPYADLDYITELDIYRQALLQLKQLPEVDSDNVFIFGHSMGGAFGPMLAAEIPVRGLAVYGAASRTWFEYLLDTLRYQGILAGESYVNTDEKVRLGSRLIALVFLENQSIEVVKSEHPELAELADAIFPDGRFNGKSLDFWRQLAEINFPEYWTKCHAHVLAVRGASDFVTYDVDHQLIADVVNRARPGSGQNVVLPDSDHLFHRFATEYDSLQNFQKGEFNTDFARLMKSWIGDVMAKEPT